MTITYSTLRNVTLDDLFTRLEEEKERKLDLVVNRDLVAIMGGQFVMPSPDGEDTLVIDPSPMMLSHLAWKARKKGIAANVTYTQLKELHALGTTPPPEGASTFQAMAHAEEAQEWLDAFDSYAGVKLRHHAPERFMVRLFKPETQGENYIGRALLGKSFRIIDNDDVTLAILGALKDVGLGGDDVQITGDLTSDNMFLRITVPAIQYVATEFLKGYQSPYRKQGEPSPLVFAGLEVRNSETGRGACSLTPRMVVQECSNGLLKTKDMVRSIHLGTSLEEGEINWSHDTHATALKLVRQKMRDAVGQWLSPEWLEHFIDQLQGAAKTPIEEPVQAIEVVAKKQDWTEDEAQGVLSHFIKGKQFTAGGVMQAMTSFAQLVPDPERAAFFEGTAIEVMESLA